MFKSKLIALATFGLIFQGPMAFAQEAQQPSASPELPAADAPAAAIPDPAAPLLPAIPALPASVAQVGPVAQPVLVPMIVGPQEQLPLLPALAGESEKAEQPGRWKPRRAEAALSLMRVSPSKGQWTTAPGVSAMGRVDIPGTPVAIEGRAGLQGGSAPDGRGTTVANASVSALGSEVSPGLDGSQTTQVKATVGYNRDRFLLRNGGVTASAGWISTDEGDMARITRVTTGEVGYNNVGKEGRTLRFAQVRETVALNMCQGNVGSPKNELCLDAAAGAAIGFLQIEGNASTRLSFQRKIAGGASKAYVGLGASGRYVLDREGSRSTGEIGLSVGAFH